MDEAKKITLEIQILCGVLLKTTAQSLEQRLAEMNMPLSRLQFHILHMVSFEARTITEVSRKMGLDPSTVSLSVDALERKGLVERKRDPKDRRRMPVTITDHGRVLLRQSHVIPDDDPSHQALLRLGDEKSAALLHLLQQMISYLPDGDETLKEIQSKIALFMQESTSSTDHDSL